MKSDKTLALFDFDGTLTTKDTFLEIIKFQKGNFQLYWSLLMFSPFIVAMKLKLIPNQKVKEKLIGYFWKGTPIEEFQKVCEDFAQEKIPQLIRPKGLDCVKNLMENGATIFIVSASIEDWIQPWAAQYGIKVLATQLEIKDGLITGKIRGKNCMGIEKVKRVKEAINSQKFEQIYAYGDTSGDKEMLTFANQPFFRVFE